MNRRRLLATAATLSAGFALTFAAPAMAVPEGGFKVNPAHDCIGATLDEVAQTGNGANDPNLTVYDPTDWVDSTNGVGTDSKGKAEGRPCAGTVGKADWKDPKGQYPDAELDGNAGYECENPDGDTVNNGVGRKAGNPAHTGCEAPEPPHGC